MAQFPHLMTPLEIGHVSVDGLEAELAGLGLELRMAGDCLTPRTAEEAVREGMKAGCAV